MPRITVAQLDWMVGDVTGNLARRVAAAHDAVAARADLVVFCKLSLTGCYQA